MVCLCRDVVTVLSTGAGGCPSAGQDTIGTEMKAFADHLKPYPHHSSELLHPSNWNNANTHSLPSYTVAWNVQFSNLASLFQDKGVV